MLKITLRAARVNSGLLNKEVAQIVHKCVDTISRYERDSSEIPHDLLMALLKLYDVSLDDIFLGKESDFIGRKKRERVLLIS
jgi:transcriptional regulator with XRE-family HTH domain